MSLKVAYVHSRLRLNEARVEFMPFTLSLLKLLDRSGHHVSLYLAEQPNPRYENAFCPRTTFHYLDNRLVWERPGRLNHLLLSLYFRWETRRAPAYDLVLGSGQVGNVLGRRLAGQAGCPFVYMSDEFPDIYGASPWRAEEEEAARSADVVVVPDETRFEKLCHQVKGLEDRTWTTLPNAPLLDDLTELPEVDWGMRLGLPAGSPVFLQAGGIYDFNQIAESMVSLPHWPEPAVLLINGKENPWAPRSSFDHLDCPGKLYWNLEPYDDPVFHSLISFSAASFGLYRKQSDLEYVGKSSGKIMRSLACGRPVIASDLFSLKFLEEQGLGVLVRHPLEIPDAVERILANQEEFNENCRRVYSQSLSYETYWARFQEICRPLVGSL